MTDETTPTEDAAHDVTVLPVESDGEGEIVTLEGAFLAYDLDEADDTAVAPEPPGPALEFDLIVASTLDGWIGKPNGALPARQKADLSQFRRLTTGHAVVMGRKTLESIGHLLPHRLNVIITHQPLLVDSWLDGGGEAVVEDRRNSASQPLIVSSFDELKRRLPEHLGEDQKAFIIGGDSVYRQALAELAVRRIWRTCIHTTFGEASPEAGWARFELPPTARLITERGPFPADADNEFRYSYEDYAVPEAAG